MAAPGGSVGRFVAAALAAAGAAWVVGTEAGAASPGESPRIVGFSPAAVHPGGVVLVDADLGGRAATVRIGGRRAAARRERRGAGAAWSDGATDRLRVRVPRRLESGAHAITLTTRSGRAAAAKPVVVARCGAPAPAGCGGTLQSGVSLQARGTGYSENFVEPAALTPVALPSQTAVSVDDGPVGLHVLLPVSPSELRPGNVSAESVTIEDFTGGFRGYWESRDAVVEVVETSPTRVRLCFDVVLLAAGMVQPTEVRLTGYMVVKR